MVCYSVTKHRRLQKIDNKFHLLSICNNTMYIGYPISLNTAFNIFGNKESMEHEEPRYTRFAAHLKKHNLELYFYDKNVYILGKRLDEFHPGNDTHYSVNDAIELIIGYKHKIAASLKAAGANLAEFDIEVMEEEPKRVQNPQLYIIT